ncbi:16S rRNA (guanine(966)-N(2))-methyltransferase RsmD [Leifsonia poae]|uniref:16S rRNA (guanine(966)-N(2))-methyltransferase RsmD n=1 Tax=Leifsonia poae TaxID=110933 RepID=UPI001CC01B5F|nr:16S rRNA (guanine(966)-N(2))-methyltransferase RsmD [Leifsonia poae]
MTRIIAGFAGSLALHVPKSGTRPTSDRVREAIFSALEARDVLVGARVLDLYAGSGALGLEAASRGAVTVMLVERDGAAATICRKNMSSLLKAAPRDSKPKIEIRATAAQTFLGSSGSTYDLVFIDPPYDVPEDEVESMLAALGPRLGPHATVCLERSTRSPEPVLPAGLELDRRKDYGDTALYWLAPA